MKMKLLFELYFVLHLILSLSQVLILLRMCISLAVAISLTLTMRMLLHHLAVIDDSISLLLDNRGDNFHASR